MKAKSVGCLFYWSLVFAFIIIQYNFLDVIIIMYLYCFYMDTCTCFFDVCGMLVCYLCLSAPTYYRTSLQGMCQTL